MRPQSSSSRSSEIDIEARTPMFCRYSQWIGETLRNVEYVRSSGRPMTGRSTGSSGAGV
ncbi:hypothetical protein SAMN05661080_03264 [Modestobacter sp. DSM 44400]|uniref:hypothetical protein n=1 Tax=Modestobacter sp. DSM 44400 TaxID=1550230 RepID=UPI0008971C74|nr:hypothetical protein SAMN05661080_03264 [Modestobacter sp. DSM 44400]